jgi:hypothetical protein
MNSAHNILQVLQKRLTDGFVARCAFGDINRGIYRVLRIPDHLLISEPENRRPLNESIGRLESKKGLLEFKQIAPRDPVAALIENFDKFPDALTRRVVGRRVQCIKFCDEMLKVSNIPEE